MQNAEMKKTKRQRKWVVANHPKMDRQHPPETFKLKEGVKWCKTTDTFVGGCGPEQCILDFSEKYGNVDAENCICNSTASGSHHTCSCQVICGSIHKGHQIN
ncbi:unnamed protein product [Linum tenue]|uniref:Uncharacterized protein n=1 Tax=Linum tenue TaxID=586396 RepID=A0AAV0RX42_9ROSI|nr:unnamed protein product [Linum tenue]